MTHHVQITFPKGGHITIELLDTPVVAKWILSFNAYKALNFPSVMVNYGLMFERLDKKISPNSEYALMRTDAINDLNAAIDDINASIEGIKFPFNAYEDMPWSQTNNIHRCFTTASASWSCWQHNLTYTQLSYCKTIHDKRRYIFDNAIRQFTIIDKTAFSSALEIINSRIHHYENTRFSDIAHHTAKEYTKKYYPDDDRDFHLSRHMIRFDKDYTFKEGRGCLNEEFCLEPFLGTCTYEEMVASFPDNYNDYDVFMYKSIGGKDYETCYINYDNPLEFDIQNMEHIVGNMVLFFTKDHQRFFGKGSKMHDWATSHGLRDEMFMNVPLGKIISRSEDIDQNWNKNTPTIELKKI
jgi:hypothetical protein|tara:strand:+ start:150 stop:1211 length:1062 start_codon:yes stop_codon:yes gene_type:complete